MDKCIFLFVNLMMYKIHRAKFRSLLNTLFDSVKKSEFSEIVGIGETLLTRIQNKELGSIRVKTYERFLKFFSEEDMSKVVSPVFTMVPNSSYKKKKRKKQATIADVKTTAKKVAKKASQEDTLAEVKDHIQTLTEALYYTGKQGDLIQELASQIQSLTVVVGNLQEQIKNLHIVVTAEEIKKEPAPVQKQRSFRSFFSKK